MPLNLKINPLPDGYELPEVKLEIKLEPYNGTKPKSPVLTGYVKLTAVQLKRLQSVFTTQEKDAVFLRVALWDNGSAGGVDGVIEYREYEGKMVQPQELVGDGSIWY